MYKSLDYNSLHTLGTNQNIKIKIKNFLSKQFVPLNHDKHNGNFATLF